MIRSTGKSLKLPPNWTVHRSIADLPVEARWHFLCLLAYCVSSKRYDGEMPLLDAERASDAADGEGVVQVLRRAGLVEILEDQLRIVEVGQYMPRSDAQAAAIRRDTTHLLYRLFDHHDNLLYVGRTWQLKDRLRHHARVQPWWVEVARHEVVQYPTFNDLAIAEIAAIKAEGPRYNHVYNVSAGLR